jgi:hypothetical protein
MQPHNTTSKAHFLSHVVLRYTLRLAHPSCTGVYGEWGRVAWLNDNNQRVESLIQLNKYSRERLGQSRIGYVWVWRSLEGTRLATWRSGGSGGGGA